MAVKTGAIFNSLIFGGVNSADYGIYITGEAVYNAPERAVETVSVPGRNGTIVIDQGHWNNIQVTYPAGTFGKSQAEFREAVSAFRNAVLSQLGYQRLTDTYHPDEYRMAVYVSGLEVDPTHYGSAGEFKLKFDCKPQRWLTSGEQEITVGEWGETETATGETVTIENPNGNLSLKSLNVAIEPVQNLNGYDKPWSGGNGKNKYPIEIGDDVWINNGSATYSNNDGELVIEATASVSSGVYGNGTQKSLVNQQSVAKTVSFDVKGSVASTIAVQGQIKDITTSYTRVSVTIPANTSASLSIYSRGTANTIYVKNLMISEDGSTAYEPYSNICPISGHDSVDVIVSPTTTASDGTTYTTALGRTVYGGTLDVVSGELTVDRAMVTFDGSQTSIGVTPNFGSGYGRALFDTLRNTALKSYDALLLSNIFTHTNDANLGLYKATINTNGILCLGIPPEITTVSEMTAWAQSNPFQICYELATPQTYQLTAQQIELLIGTNNIWSDGNVTAEYGQDPDALYNPTPYDASPLLMVEGYGTIGFNGYEIEIENAVLGEVELARSTGFPLPPIGTMNYENSIPFNDQLLLEGDEFTISFPYMKWTTNLDGWGFDYPLTLQTLVDSNSDATTTLDAGQHIPTLPHPSPGGSWAGNYNYTTVISPIRFEKGTAKTWSDTVTASNSIFKSGTSETENLSFAFDISVIYDGVSPEVKVVRSVSFSDATVIRSNSYHIAHCRHSEITGYSSVSILGDPTYIDCDLGDAYMIKDGSYISLNSYIDLGSDLPVLASGNNELAVDNTITELKIVPRWWIL